VKEHYCYFLREKNKVVGVICGDTVFNGGVGNCKDGGNPRQLFETIRDHFYKLEDDVLIYPSHDYFLNNLAFALTVDPQNQRIVDYQKKIEKLASENKFYISSISEEKKYNPFFRVFNEDFQQLHQMKDEQLFVHLRSERDKW
jgi:hydroxyacylglutathione hydrolase